MHLVALPPRLSTLRLGLLANSSSRSVRITAVPLAMRGDALLNDA
jgi:hypothetical protein